jgi:hypothetical protein
MFLVVALVTVASTTFTQFRNLTQFSHEDSARPEAKKERKTIPYYEVVSSELNLRARGSAHFDHLDHLP